jgi:hypothetical protein
MTESTHSSPLDRLRLVACGSSSLLALVLLCAGGRIAFGQGPKGDSRAVQFGVRTMSAYEKNPLFVTDGPEDISTQLSGTGAFLMSLGQTDLSLSGQADRSFYRRITQLDHFTYTGNGAAHIAVTPRFALQGAASYATLTIAAQSSIDTPGEPTPPVSPTAIAGPVVTTNAVAVPSTIFHSLSTAGAMSYALSERTASQVQVAYNQVRFDTSGVPNGSTFSAGGTLQHRYAEHGAVGAVYQFQTNGGVAQAVTVHSLLGSWGNSYERIDLTVQAGLLSNATSGQQSWTEPGGGAQFGYRLSRGTFAVRYDRSAAQAFGLGKILITDQGTLGLTQTFAKYALHATATASRGHDTELKSYKLGTYSAELGLERPLISTVRLVASTYYRKRSDVFSASDNGVRVLLSYDGHYF